MSWYRGVIEKLEVSGIFADVEVIGAKVRGIIKKDLYLDIYYDPKTCSYSYALIDRALPFPGDKRVFGWDDYPHENVNEIKELESYPHHFQKRKKGQKGWTWQESQMRGELPEELDVVIDEIKSYLKLE